MNLSSSKSSLNTVETCGDISSIVTLLGAVSKTKNLLNFRLTAAKTSVVLACASVSAPVGSAACATNSPSANDPPPLKWSDLRYVFDIKEDCNGKEAIQA